MISPATTGPLIINEDAGGVSEIQAQYVELKHNYDVLAHNYAEALEKIAFFEEQIRLLRHKQFGRSSEKTSPEQGLLFTEAEPEGTRNDSPDDTTTVTYERKKNNRPKRNQFPIHWPRREIVHDIDPQEKLDEHGQPLALMGYDEFEQVSVSPARYEVVIHKRPKYAKETEGGNTRVLQAPPAVVPLPKSLATPSLLADIITSKFVEHLPLHRYEQRCARQHFSLPRATQARWLIRLCDSGGLLLPLAHLILDQLRELSVMHCDETRFQVFNDDQRQNPDSANAYAWLLAGVAEFDGRPIKLAYYHYSPSKACEVIDELIGDFSGYLVVDGYSGFDRLERQRAATEHPITLCGCWDHSRRRFKDAEKGMKKTDKRMSLTHQGAALINRLYRIEREIKEKPPAEKLAHRQEYTVPALADLKSWLDKTRPGVNPKGYLGEAISYTQNQFEKLQRYASTGDVPCSNIFCEQQAKKFAVGRSNWMFSNTPAGARASCVLYTLTVTACLNQVDPFAYFRYILAVLPTVKTLEALEALLPWRVSPDLIKDFDEFSYCRGKPPD